MKTLAFLLALATAWLVLPASLTAQEGTAVRQGDRVRISTEESGRLCVGEVVARTSDTIRVDCWQPTVGTWEAVDFPVTSIAGLEVHRGTKSNAGKGALLGGLIGAGFGLALGIAATADDCEADPADWDWCWWWDEGEVIPLSMATFGLAGAGVGALIGMLSRRDRWEPIPPSRLRARISPMDGGVGLAFSVGF